jgi:hypothetical protein
MTDYLITHEETGKKFKFTGDNPPTEQDMSDVFSQAGLSKKKELPKGVTRDEMNKIEEMRRISAEEPGTFAQKTAQGAIVSKYRNLEKPKSKLQKGVEIAGGVGGFALEAGAGMLGNLVGFATGGPEGARRVSAATTGAARAGTATIRESYQDLTGRQDDLPIEAGLKPLKEGAETAALSYTIDKALQAGGKVVKKIKDKFAKKGPIGADDLNTFYANTGKRARQTLEKLYENVNDGAKKVGIDADDLLRKSKDKFGNWRFNGDIKMDKQIGEIYKEQMAPVLKESDRVFKKTDLLEIVENNRSKAGNDKITDAAIEFAKEHLPDNISPLELYDFKKDAMNGVFTKAGKVKSAVNSASGAEAGWAALSMIKEIDGTEAALREMSERYAWKSAIIDNGLKLQKQLAQQSMDDVLANTAKMAAAGSTAIWSPIVGILGAASQAPQLVKSISKPSLAKFAQGTGKRIAEDPIKRAIKSQVPRSLGVPAGRNIIQSLFGR